LDRPIDQPGGRGITAARPGTDEPPTPVIPPNHLEQLRTHRKPTASAVQATGVMHPLRDLVVAW